MKDSITLDDIKKAVLTYFYNNPNTSVKEYFKKIPVEVEGLKEMVVGAVCLMREKDKTLINSGGTYNDVWVSVDENIVDVSELEKCNE